METTKVEMTKERASIIALRIIHIDVCHNYNNDLKIIKAIDLDQNLCLEFLLKRFKEDHKNKEICTLLSEIEDYIENDEDIEEISSSLNISSSEFKEFELYLYYNHLK